MCGGLSSYYTDVFGVLVHKIGKTQEVEDLREHVFGFEWKNHERILSCFRDRQVRRLKDDSFQIYVVLLSRLWWAMTRAEKLGPYAY